MTENAIKISGLVKKFGDFEVHKGIDLNVEQGKITYIMGGSGEGKSVLLKQIMGFIRPTAGTIEIHGEELDCRNRKQLIKLRKSMGILFQYGALFDSMSVFDNIAFPLREQTRTPKYEIKERVEELLTAVGLDLVHAPKLPSDLSGGQRKRVALARAVALRPSIMMYDEPTTGLDPITTHMVTELICNTNRQFNLTSIVISHDTHVALQAAQRIAFLKNGKIQFFGEPDEVKDIKDDEVREFFELNQHDYHGQSTGTGGKSGKKGSNS